MMVLEYLNTRQAPEAIGPYNQAVKAGNLLFVSGQLPIDPVTGEMVKGDSGVQTKQCMKNVLAILEASGLDENNIAKATIYVTNLGEFNLVNEAYGAFFVKDYPARACIEVSSLPKGAGVEIEAVACL